MPMPRAPIDPYCPPQGKPSRVEPNDTDGNLAQLSTYAKGLGVRVWRYDDGKIALTSKRWAKELGSEHAPLMFGREGATIGETAGEAFNALYAQSARIEQRIGMTSKVERQTAARTLDPVHPVADPISLSGDMGATVRTFLEQQPKLDEAARYLTNQRWLQGNPLIAAESSLARFGPTGKGLATLFRRRNELVDRIRAKTLTTLKAQLDKLTPEENARGFQRYVEYGEVADEARRPVLEGVYQALKTINDEFYANVQALGADVAPKLQPSSLVPTGNYFPHRFDMGALVSNRLSRELIDDTISGAAQHGVTLSREEAIGVLEKQGLGAPDYLVRKRIIENAAKHGATIGDSQAQEIVDKYVRKNAERISGSLERDRLGVEGYITDARRAYTATWTRNAHRLSDLTVFGNRDANVHSLIDAMAFDDTLGPRAQKFARDLYHLEIGRDQVILGPFAKELYNWQGAKLSLSVLANATQPLNIPITTGFRPFLKAAADVVRRRMAGETFEAQAARGGAIPIQMFESDATTSLIHGSLEDIRNQGMTAMIGHADAPQNLVARYAIGASKTAQQVSIAAFRYVENFNRALAQRAGELYFDQLATAAETVGQGGSLPSKISRRLGELDLDPQQVIRALQQGDAQSLGEMRALAGLRTSNLTQFRSDYQSMPLWANQSELGRFMGQFKGFAFGQSRFMLRNVFGPNKPIEDRLRALAVVAGVYPVVGIALTSARQSLMGPTLASDELNRRLEDPTIANVVTAGLVGMTMAGGLGVLADVGLTAVLGNSYALHTFVIPPAFTTVLNGVDALSSTARAAVNGDPRELVRARKAALRELGGLGSAIENVREQQEGTAKTAPDPFQSMLDAVGL